MAVIRACFKKHKDKRFICFMRTYSGHINAVLVDLHERHYYEVDEQHWDQKSAVERIISVFGPLSKTIPPKYFDRLSPKTDNMRTCGHWVCDQVLGILRTISKEVM